MRITKELNERLTQVSAGTPMGEVFRRYWIPACLAAEVGEPDGAPIRVRILGEDLVAFRDSTGEVGLVEAFCAHRRAPLFFGRNEEAGLRCVYHGWKFDTQGMCVDMPSEPPYSKFRLRVGIKAYPTYEAGGVIWTYMGPTVEMPPPPNYELCRVPNEYLGVSKTGEHCNYLQAIEGGIDSSHSSFLHWNDLSNDTDARRMDKHPQIETEKTDFGFSYACIRRVPDDQVHIKFHQYLLPCHVMRGDLVGKKPKSEQNGPPRIRDVVRGHLWVPIDDENTFVYNYAYMANSKSPDVIGKEAWEIDEGIYGRAPGAFIPGTPWLKQNPMNDYLIDREAQRTKSFTGIKGGNTQDFAVQEGMGSIVRRDLEALGSTDKAVQEVRDLLLEAAEDVEAGRSPRGSSAESQGQVRGASVMAPIGTPWLDAAKEVCLAQW